MAKFIIDKSSGSGTATIKVKPNSDNDTSKTNYGVLKVYKKGDDQEKTLVGQVSLTQKAEVKPVTTYHLELWSSDGSKELLDVSDGNESYNANLNYFVGMGTTVLGTNTYIVKSYALIKTGSTVSKKKVPIILAIDDQYLKVDASAVNNENISIDDSKLVIDNQKALDRTALIEITQNRVYLGDYSGTISMGINLTISPIKINM